jgi:hypothetical protein
MRVPESLNTVVRRLANADLTYEEEQVRRAILEAFAADGTSPTVDDIIVRIPVLEAQEITRICRALADKDLIVWDDVCQCVHSAYPFSGLPTSHTVHLQEGPTIFALCAVDALGMPVMLGQAADILSHCAYCNARIEVAVSTDGLGRYHPRDSAVWFPMAEDVCCPVAESRCPDINFFCSGMHRDSWWQAKGRPEGLPLTMGEAFDVGREIFGTLLARPKSDVA